MGEKPRNIIIPQHEGFGLDIRRNFRGLSLDQVLTESCGMAFFCRSRGGIECTLMSRQGNGHLSHLHICMEHLFYMGHTTRFLAYKGGV